MPIYALWAKLSYIILYDGPLRDNELSITVGTDHVQTLQTLTLLSRLAKDMGRFKDSLKYDNTLYNISMKKFGDGDERVARCCTTTCSNALFEWQI